ETLSVFKGCEGVGMITVFDVARFFIRKSPTRSIPAITLQKLCFYAYGWYAYETARPLFREHFYAMKHGPVISDLYSAHAKTIEVTEEPLARAQERHGFSPAEFSLYEKEILEAVWDYYSPHDRWELRDMTHEEQPWITAWNNRVEGSERADLPSSDIIDHFIAKKVPEGLELPERAVTVFEEEPVADFDHGSFVEDILALCRA
ncbi:DUF4065 domain-containing protein, partial [Actinotignum timonense]